MDTIIETGSDLNQRTFDENESWNSILMESKILAGNDPENDEFDKFNTQENLSTVQELSEISESFLYDDNKLNMNIDAISDDEVFFDCKTSPMPSRDQRSPIRHKTPYPSKAQGQSAQFLSVNMAISLHSDETTSEDNKTGSMLVQICEDFNDLKDHAQSTPKVISDIESGSSISLGTNCTTSYKETSISEIDSSSCKKKLDFYNADTLKISKKNVYAESTKTEGSTVNDSKIQNYFSGKYRLDPNSVKKGKTQQSKIKTPVKSKVRRVTLMKEFFENRARLQEQSVNVTKAPAGKSMRVNKSIVQPKTVRKELIQSQNVINSTKLTKTNPPEKVKAPKKSPTYQTRKVSQKFIRVNYSPRIKSSYNSSGGSSFLLKNQPKVSLRPSSCSEFPSELSSPCSLHHRSKSTSDLSSDTSDKTNFVYAVKMNRIVARSYAINNQRTTLHKVSPVKKVSAIMKRRSVGFAKSPVKPVRELRKIFSPSKNGMKAEVSKKNISCVPRILLNHKTITE